MFAVANKRTENTLLSLFIHSGKGKQTGNKSFGFGERRDNQGTGREYDCEVHGVMCYFCCWDAGVSAPAA